MLTAASFFDLNDFPHAELFSSTEYVWDALKNIKTYMDNTISSTLDYSRLCDGVLINKSLIFSEGKLYPASECTIQYGDATKGKLQVIAQGQEVPGASVIMAGAVLMGQQISIGSGVLIESGAMIKEPAIIGDQSEVRQGAYLRGYCLIGKRCVVGHTTEVKHSIFLNDAKAGHFNYLGDSILGGKVNLGAGTKLANLRFLPGNVKIKAGKKLLDSGLRKFGAILGDDAQTGCNSVTNPGTLMAKESILLPNTTASSGYHPEKSLIK